MSDQTLDSPPPPLPDQPPPLDSSSSLPDQPPPLDSSSSLPDQPPPSDSSSSSSSLSRNSSFSKLNAQAPEFVPKKSVTPPPLADPRVIVVPPPPPPPVHLYPPPPPQVNSPFPVVPLPHLNHPHPHPPHHHPHHQHHQDHHHHHNQHQQHHHHRNHHHHHHQKHHHQDNQQDKEQGQGSNNSNGGSKNNNNNNNSNNNNNNNGLSDESTQKLINQVEYYFSDVNLATTDHLIKFINKDTEGFVPISVVASFKKIKALISSNSQLAAVLKNSTKLVVSEDGKKVKRLHPLTGSDMEELQARIIVAENLPEDHCHQNLMKVFSTVGSVKSIRTCQPQPSNNGASSASRPSKTDNMHYCNKLHAFVEYESIELAEKAITELNDENNWRNGLRVRPLVKHGSKSGQPRGKKSGNEGDVTCEEEDASTSEQKQNEKPAEDPSGQPGVNSHDQGDEQNLEKEGGQKKGRNRGRAKGRGRGNHIHNHNHQNNRGHHVGSPPVNNAINGEHPIGAKQQPPGPRMPDGTRGFSMGRGRPVAVNTTA